MQEDKRTEVATGLSEKFSKNPEYYSRFDTTFHDQNQSQRWLNINDCCVDYDKYKLYTFRNFMVYLGKHTMPVFLFKGEKKAENLDNIRFFHIFFKLFFFTDILPKLRAEFTFRSRIANLASNMIRLVLLDEIYWTNILQNSFSTALRIQETDFCGTSRKKRG